MFQRIIVPPSSGSGGHTLLGLLDPPKKRHYVCLKHWYLFTVNIA